MEPWELTDAEWERLRPILRGSGVVERGRGRPRLENDRDAARACLFRHYHSRSARYHCFGWNELPREFGVSPSTANRRFREWNADGSWLQFWDALMELRRGARPHPRRPAPHWAGNPPVSGILDELERAYRFFNAYFFGDSLPSGIAITLQVSQPHGRKLGNFCGQEWRNENQVLDQICIFTLSLGSGPELALGTLLHEMVHQRNYRLSLVDCTDNGRYHNAHFRDAALLAGLDCPPTADKHHGYQATRPGPRALAAIFRLRPHEPSFRWHAGRGLPEAGD
jgi:transposase